MNIADQKSLEARIADLEDRMDNVVEGALLLTDVVETLSKNVNVLRSNYEILRKGMVTLTKVTKAALQREILRDNS